MPAPNPEHPRPYEIEIRVDGRTYHRFLAERFTTHEDGELLTLEAARWQFAAMLAWPASIEPEPTPLEQAHKEAHTRAAMLRLGSDAIDFLNTGHGHYEATPIGIEADWPTTKGDD